MIQFTVPGPPVPQSRPQVFRNGGVKTDSDQVAGYKLAIRAACPRGEVLKGPLHVTIVAVFKRKKVTDSWHWKRPDIDNISKAILDAIQGIVYSDDGQVSKIEVEKRQSTDEEGTLIRIEQLTQSV